MFYAKFIFAAVAVFGLVASVVASPVAQPIAEVATTELVRRTGGQDVYDVCQGVYNDCLPEIAALASATVTADIVAHINAIVNIFAVAKVNLLGLVGVDITAFVSAIVALHVTIIVQLVAALAAHPFLSLSLFAQIDAALCAYLDALVQIHATICVSIGSGIPLLSINIFVFIKLVLTVAILGLGYLL